ncbi:transposase, partial [Micromonospora sp. NPDC023633]|uniref:transposase n=1 Tax=Micromonospora sp. NPDC023633 TaxID=3154320 RepID=UPI0033FD13BE
QHGGRHGQDAFTIDWEQQHVTCPNGVTSTQWHHRHSQHGQPVIRVRFNPADCRVCPHLRDCVSSPKAERRELTLRHRAEHDTVRTARQQQQTDDWKHRYKIRAGVEGTISQGVQRCGLRRSRYRGLDKTALQHQLTGTAINLARIDAHLTKTPRAGTRTSHFAQLRPAG